MIRKILIGLIIAIGIFFMTFWERYTDVEWAIFYKGAIIGSAICLFLINIFNGRKVE
jgi:hypothetical protein